MEKKKIAVLFGGCSTEYEVSLQSAYAVLTHLDLQKYEIFAIGITRDGDWYHYIGDAKKLLNNTWFEEKKQCFKVCVSQSRSDHGLIEGHQMIHIDAAFPILHGINGEDGTVQGLFELAGIPVIGCGTLASSLCMDKHRAHRLVQDAGIRVPKAVTIQSYEKESVKQRVQDLKYPLFVKPVRAGSSIGISKISCLEELSEAVDLAFQYDHEVIIEENIEGFEVGCGIIGTSHLICGGVDEIELNQDFFDYKEKYQDGSSKIHLPARIEKKLQIKIQKAAKIVYRALGCSGFARVDLFLTPQNEIVFNEVNTIPGMTSHSRFPNMMKAVGFSFSQMLDQIIEADDMK